MARSNAIWVVTKAHDLMASFTVKHELITWLRRQVSLEHTFVQRTPDGGAGLPGPLVAARTFIA